MKQQGSLPAALCPKSQLKPQHTWRWNSAEGRGECKSTGNSGFELYSWSPLLLLTPSINQLSKGADWERFTVAQWQFCCSEPTNHPGSFVSCLKVPPRALLLALPVAQGRSASPFACPCRGWHSRRRKGMPWSHGSNRAVHKQHVPEASCIPEIQGFPFWM